MIGWQTLKYFTSDEAVSTAVLANAPEGGIYVLPAPTDGQPDVEKLTTGPFIFASVVRGGTPAMGPLMGFAFLGQFVAAALMTCLVRRASRRSFGGKFCCILTVALIICAAAHAPDSIWWHYPLHYNGIMVLDTLIGWALAAIPIAMVAGRGTAENA